MTIRLWDAQTGGQVLANPLQGHTSSVNSVAFSPDGRYIVSGSGDSTIWLWDAQTGKQVGHPLQGHTSSVNSVAFSPDGRHIVSGSWDKTIQLWNAQIGGQVGNPLQGHTGSVLSVAFSPDGRHIVSGSVKSGSTPVGGPVKSGRRRTKVKGRGLDKRLVQLELVTTWIQWLRITSVDPLHRFRSRGDRDRDGDGQELE